MTSTLSNWYHNQYAAWNRTRRLHAPTFLARTDSQAARAARVATANSASNGDAVINMGDVLNPGAGERTQPFEKKKQTLFGPSIGIVNPGPDWAQESYEVEEKVKIQDTLTPELVKNWVEKNKEGSQPTTTLQALVNLKRPSLRLSPITHDEPEDADPSQPVHHGLEFQFDCDAPKCRITLHVVPPTSSTESSSSTSKPIVLFNMVVDGGFSRILKLEEGAMLELDKYDSATQFKSDPTSSQFRLPLAGTSATASASQTALASSDQPPANVPHSKKRFHLRIRKRTHPHAAEDTTRLSVAGPALQVVDMEAPTENSHKEKDESGVKIFVKLEALDVNEHSLASRNSQTTYLHIVRLGASPESGSSDTRPWVVRVVKREATIGPHSFHLHEIYGLSSHTPNNNTQHSPSNNETTHSYPPTAAVDNDDPTAECLLCLSSPREVVLLPCRHLVACKECAVNMVEFGAGGQLVHAEDTVDVPSSNNATVVAAANTTAGEGSGNATGEDSGTGAAAGGGVATTTTTTVTTAPQVRPRRKRKPKGWFCPVCRQPYTSLLRISTGAPVCVLNKKAKDIDHEDRASSPDTVDSHSHPHPHSTPSHHPLSLETVAPSPITPIPENAGDDTAEEVVVEAQMPVSTPPAPPASAPVPAEETSTPHLENINTSDTNEEDITESSREETYYDASPEEAYQDISPDVTGHDHQVVANAAEGVSAGSE